MAYIALYSALLLIGMVFSQLVPDISHSIPLQTANTICLAYIMMEVGLEFSLDKTRLRQYGWDFLVAVIAALAPWMLCGLYFYNALTVPVADALLIASFAAPTSAGILFTMLAAAGLAGTWLFQKARNLAIFDDLATILLLIPLQLMFVKLSWDSLYLIAIMLGLLAAAYIFLHSLRWPVTPPWLLLYSILLVFILDRVHQHFEIHLEVLLPAFALGCILRATHSTNKQHKDAYRWIDPSVKGSFMLLVGCALPVLELGIMSWKLTLLHVIALTLLSNLGKLFPTLCYRREAVQNERLALSIAMFPRGEVGAGILLLAISYHLSSEAIVLGVLSLALNLLLTGPFIWTVLALAPPAESKPMIRN